MKAETKWVRVPDTEVRHVWRCPTCKKTVTLPPTFYADSGTPICTNFDCEFEGGDLEYRYTEVRTA